MTMIRTPAIRKCKFATANENVFVLKAQAHGRASSQSTWSKS